NRETSPLNLSTFSTSGSGSSYGYLGGGYQIAWENASNAASSNNAYAQSSAKVTRVPGEEGSGFTFGFHTGTYYSNYLNITNLSGSVPSNATITGIEVRIEKKEVKGPCGHTGSPHMYVSDNTVQLIVGGSRTGSNKAK